MRMLAMVGVEVDTAAQLPPESVTGRGFVPPTSTEQAQMDSGIKEGAVKEAPLASSVSRPLLSSRLSASVETEAKEVLLSCSRPASRVAATVRAISDQHRSDRRAQQCK